MLILKLYRVNRPMNTLEDPTLYKEKWSLQEYVPHRGGSNEHALPLFCTKTIKENYRLATQNCHF